MSKQCNWPCKKHKLTHPPWIYFHLNALILSLRSHADLFLQMSAWEPITVWIGLKFTLISLKARTPLQAGNEPVSVWVTWPEEGFSAHITILWAQAGQLWLVELKVKVCVQSGEHPAQRVLTEGHLTHVDLYKTYRGHRKIFNLTLISFSWLLG